MAKQKQNAITLVTNKHLKENIMAANVQLLALGHAFEEGVRGAKGGAPSRDSVWGVLRIQGNLVTFGGRRGASTYRFNTHKKADFEKVMAFYATKLVKAGGGFKYTDVSDEEARAALVDTAKLATMFYKAMSAKKLNIRRAKAPVANAAPAAVEAVSAVDESPAE